MATTNDMVVNKDDRKVVIAALGLYESSVRRAMRSAAAPVVAEAHAKVLADVERVQALFR